MLTNGETLGRYRVGEYLGSGGAGTVHAAVHTTLGTEHALKVLRIDDPGGRRRLLAEGRAQARLAHPNVVPVRDALQLEDGRPVLVFDRVHGPTLRLLLKHASLPRDEAVRLWRGIVEGVAHAHSHGVVHRDLKPANILLDATTTPSCPRVTDFGIARCMDGATEPAQVMGTPAYQAPEQRAGVSSAGPEADVYSLGVLLLELIDGPPDDLAHIAARCLQARPEDRYADAQALLAALNAPTSTIQPPTPRAPVWSVALVVLAAGLAVTLGVVLLRAEPKNPAPTLERTAWTRAADHPAEALALLRAAASLRGRSIPDSLVFDLVDRGAAQHVLVMPDSVPTIDVRDGHVAAITTLGEVVLWERDTGVEVSRFSTGVYQPQVLQLWPAAAGVVVEHHPTMGASQTETLAWDRSGKAVVHAPGAAAHTLVGDRVVANVGADLVGWDLHGGEVWRRNNAAGPLHAAGDSVVSLTSDSHHRTRVSDGAVLDPLPLPSGLWGLSPDGRWAVARGEGTLRWLDASTGHVQVEHAVSGVNHVAWDSSGEAMCVWGENASHVRLVRRDGTVLLDGHDRQGARASFLHDGQVVTTSWDGQVRLWGERGQALHTLGRHTGLVSSLKVDGDAMITGSLDHTVRIWARPDRLHGSLRTRQGPDLRRSARTVVGVDDAVLMGAHDGWVTTWSPSDNRVERVRAGSDRVVSVGRAGSTVVGVQADGVATVWHDGERVQVQTVPQPIRVAVSADGQLFAVASRTHLGLWTRQGRPVAGGPLSGYHVVLSFSADGERLYVGHGDLGQVDVWNVASGTPSNTLRAELEGTRGVSRMRVAEGRVAVGFFGGGAAVFEAETGGVWTAPSSDDVVWIDIVADRVLIASRDGAVQLRHAKTGLSLGQTQLEEMATTALVGPDRVILGDARGRLVDWSLGSSPRVRPAHRGPVAHLFRRDGAVWTVGLDGLARAWDERGLAAPVGGVASTGLLSNLRVCRDSHRVVAVVPFPDAETVWAPDSLCHP